MNDRIRELLAQAISDVDHIYHGPGAEQLNEDLSQMFIPDVFADRFAELIVTECVAQCWTVSEIEHKGNVLSECSKRMRKYFGVEP